MTVQQLPTIAAVMVNKRGNPTSVWYRIFQSLVDAADKRAADQIAIDNAQSSQITFLAGQVAALTLRVDDLEARVIALENPTP